MPTSKTTMALKPFYFSSQAKAEKPGSLAILFFLLGAPHIYSALRKRPSGGASLSVLALVSKKVGIGVLAVALIGVIKFLAH